MIETTLSEKLARIFKMRKVSFDTPSESAEQDSMFVEIQSVRSSIKADRYHARVTGRLRIFASSSKIPFGFFPKAIEQAEPEDAVSFFFFDLEESSGRYANLVERSASFVFFANEQYDPNAGLINQINFIEQVSE